ncbi:hypothetical protein [Micromonospora sp. NPDC007230]
MNATLNLTATRLILPVRQRADHHPLTGSGSNATALEPAGRGWGNRR